MEAKDMAVERGETFGIAAEVAAPPRPRPQEAPTLPVAGDKDIRIVVTEPGKPPEAPKKQPSKIKLIARFAGAILALIGTGGPATDHHIKYESEMTPSAVGRDIASIPGFYWDFGKSIVEDIRRLFHKEAPVSPIFDNNADSASIQAGINAVPISQDELPSLLKDAIKPIEKGEFPQVSIFMPVKLDKDQRIETATIYVNQVFNPITEKPDLLPVGKRLTIPERGTEIIVPVEGAEIFQLTPYMVKGEPYFNGIAIQFFGPDETRYKLIINSPEDIRQLVPTDAIKNAPTVDPIDLIKYNPNVVKGKGLSLPVGATVMKTNMDNANVQITLGFNSSQYSRGGSTGFVFVTDDQNSDVLYLPSSTNR